MTGSRCPDSCTKTVGTTIARETAASGTAGTNAHRSEGGDRHGREDEIGRRRRLGDRRDEEESEREQRDDPAKVVSFEPTSTGPCNHTIDCTPRLPLGPPPQGGVAHSDRERSLSGPVATPASRTSPKSVVEDRQVELPEALRVGEDVDLHDLPAPDRVAADCERLSVAGRDTAKRAVDERRPRDQAEP